MNEILKKRIEEAANDRYTDNTFAYNGFIYGAEYALSHQWISVDEALPKEDFDVFMNVYVEVNTGHGIEHCVLLATYASGKFSCETKQVKVIEWMPIPKFENIEHEIKLVENTDTVYYKTPDMDGGFTTGQYVAFHEEAKGAVKEALKAYYRQKISKLEQQFKEL